MKKIAMFAAVMLVPLTMMGCDYNPRVYKNAQVTTSDSVKSHATEKPIWGKWSSRDYITVDGQRVYVGMTSDASVKILNPSGRYGESPYARSDPTVLQLAYSLQVAHHFQFRGGAIQVDITYKRVVDPGPYQITKILRRQKIVKTVVHSKKVKKENQELAEPNGVRTTPTGSRCARLIRLSQNRAALEAMSLKDLEQLYIDLSNCE